MKTSFKRFAALVLAAVMVLGTMHISMGATGNLTVDPELVVSGLQDGDVAHFYQVIAWENSDETHDGGWIYTSDFASLATANPPVSVTAIIGSSPDGSDWGLTSEIAGKIAVIPTGAGIAVPASNGQAVLNKAANGGKDVPAGMYLVLITPKDPDTVYNPVFVSADYNQDNPSASWMVDSTTSTYQDEAATKKSTLTIDKSASTDEASWQDNKWTTTRIGESVDFAVTTTIPGYGEVYTDPKFEMTDTLTALKLVKNSVKLDTPANLVVATGADDAAKYASTTGDYWITEADDGLSYTVKFTKKYLQERDTPTAIKVTYTAIVTTDAPMNVNEEKNEVSITYSHNPNDQTDYNVKKDDTVHYTFSIDADAFFSEGHNIGGSASEVVKVGRKSDGTPINKIKTSSWFNDTKFQEGPLEGATFKLYTAQACNPTDEYIPKSADGSDLQPLTLTSDSMGRIKITGLDAGTYYIKEVSAPAGYIKDQHEHSIQIEAFTKPESVTQWYGSNKIWYSSLAAVTAAGATPAKSATYTVDLLDYYTVKFDGVIAASHRFNHDNGITSSWEQGPSIEIPSSIVNTQGVELPSTGGIGTTIFYAGGAMLVLLAGILLVSKRRMA